MDVYGLILHPFIYHAARWGTRKVCMAGALLSACGLVLGSFAKTLAHVMVAYRFFYIMQHAITDAASSIITGVGFGLMYLPAIVATANHFTK